jgi:hypothetical protein
MDRMTHESHRGISQAEQVRHEVQIAKADLHLLAGLMEPVNRELGSQWPIVRELCNGLSGLAGESIAALDRALLLLGSKQ